MSRTMPSNWDGLTPRLTTKKVEAFERQYQMALGDEDKAGTIEDSAYYEGYQMALEWVLDVLYDKEGLNGT